MRTLHRGSIDSKDEEESKSSSSLLCGFGYDLDEDMMNNNGGRKPPPQPATAAVNSIHWDVEEDHLLSYFLGANDGTGSSAANDNNNGNIPASDVAVEQQRRQHFNPMLPATMRHSSSQPNSTGNMASIIEGKQQHHSSLENFAHVRSAGSSGGLSTASSAGALPVTPAVHFFDGHHSHSHRPSNNNQQQGQQQQQTAAMMMGLGNMPSHSAEYNSFVHASQQQRLSSSSLQNRTSSAGSMHKVPSRTSNGSASVGSRDSSSSSLTSMAAALALGGPNQVMLMQQKLQSRSADNPYAGGVNHHLSSTSPITPVNMMGSPSGQEMMMLPPPPRFPNGGVPHPGGMMMGQQQLNMHQMQQNMQQQHIVHQQQNNMQQQQLMQQHMQSMQQQQQQQQHQQQPVMPTVVEFNYANHQQLNNNNAASQNNVQNQQTNFLPQMNPPPGAAAVQSIQHSMHEKHHNIGGFPDPNSITSAVLAQPQQQQPQLQPQQLQPQQLQPQQLQPHQQPQMQPQQPSQQQQVQQQPQHQQIQIGLNNGQTIPLTAIPTPNGSVYYQIDPNAPIPAAANSASLRYFTKAINEVSKSDENKEAVDPKVLAEKRQQRLARNRESARQSRRRKKEHLSNLAAKVQRLQRQLEAEVRNKIRSMEAGLVRHGTQLADKWLLAKNEDGTLKQRRSDALAAVLRKTGPNCRIRRAVVAHQYNFLRQSFLSTHSHYAVWMMMQSSSFFTEANTRRLGAMGLTSTSGGAAASAGSVCSEDGGAASGAMTAASKTTSGPRANSKQIGEEIFNQERKNGGGNEKGMITCDANDRLRAWPLYCHEITMTMEQEERIINQAHGQARDTPNLQSKLHRMKTATDATRHLQNAMLCHTQLASQRNESLLLEILTPEQAAAFLEYMRKNKERLRSIMDRQLRNGAGGDGSAAGRSNHVESESTLGGVCRELEYMRLHQEGDDNEKRGG